MMLQLPDEDATRALGAALARTLEPGLVIYLQGDLGAGKTTLVRELLRALGHVGKVKSPTFTLAELYAISNFVIYHFDFYRFTDAREWIDAGFREAFTDESVCLVEWPEKAAGMLPVPDLHIALDFVGTGRTADVTAGSPRGARCLERFTEIWRGSH